MTRRSIFGLPLTLAMLCWGQSKPNFSGVWLMNNQESQFSSPNADRSGKLVTTVQHRGDSLHYEISGETGGRKFAFPVEVELGGPAFVSDAAGVVSAVLKGDSLAINIRFNPRKDNHSEEQHTWTLSADGKKLMDEVVVHPPQGQPAVNLRRVFDKQ